MAHRTTDSSFTLITAITIVIILHLSPDTRQAGLVVMVEVTLVIPLTQADSLAPYFGQILCHVLHGLHPHGEVGERGGHQGQVPPVGMTFRARPVH